MPTDQTRDEAAFAEWWSGHPEFADHNPVSRYLNSQIARAAWDARASAPAGEGEQYAPDAEGPVNFYERDFYPLSNFSAFNLDFGGRLWPTSEHAYHGMKFTAKWAVEAIFHAPSAHEAFKLAEKLKPNRRPEWDDIKIDIMRRIIRAKADQHEYVRRKLLATGDRQLVEGSWRDSFWGAGPEGAGHNVLGKLWMELRAELRTPTPTAEDAILRAGKRGP